jgi:peptidoglycan/xylan/chitin deacetylase (PgdA/CDA1 family)
VPGPPVVLAYHAIHEPQPGIHAPDVIDPPATLERDVRALLAAGYRIRTAGELVAETGGAEPPAGTAVLTFDDGWRDGLTVAAPLLARLGVHATFYVCPELFGNHDPRMGEAGRMLLGPDEARALHDAGMELGAHSLNHPDLTEIGDDELRRQLAGSKEQVEAITGEPCRTFAYPFGCHDGRVRRAAAAAGYALAFQYAPGPWQALAAPRLPAPWVRG